MYRTDNQLVAIKPSKKLYFLGVAFIIVFSIIAVTILVSSLIGLGNHGHKFVAPSTINLDLDEGTYTVFYEYRSVFEGKSYHTTDADISGLQLAVYDQTHDRIIDVALASMNSNYTIGKRSGYSVLEFKLSEPAKVKVDTWYSSDNDTQVVLNIQSGLGASIAFGIIGFLFLELTGLLIGVFIIIFVSYKRGKAIRAYNLKEREKEKALREEAVIVGEANREASEGKTSILWQQFLDNRAIDDDTKYDVWSFGDSPEMSDELVALVLEGKKTASSSLYKTYELEGQAIPRKGQYSIILDGSGKERCIIETTSIQVMSCGDVDETFAGLEGEGDLSLAYWRRVHRAFFERELAGTGIEFSQDLLVVLEVFEVVFK